VSEEHVQIIANLALSCGRWQSSDRRPGRHGIDVLGNSVGIGSFAADEESEERDTRRMFEIDFFGLAWMIHAVLSGGGRCSPRHDAARVGDNSLSPRTVYCRRRRNPRVLVRRPADPRQYLIVEGGKLAGTGARFYYGYAVKAVKRRAK
jgi:NAD(P)-dependent dehydrogenase (short-subunit alcohol dehydrogenase family)